MRRIICLFSILKHWENLSGQLMKFRRFWCKNHYFAPNKFMVCLQSKLEKLQPFLPDFHIKDLKKSKTWKSIWTTQSKFVTDICYGQLLHKNEITWAIPENRKIPQNSPNMGASPYFLERRFFFKDPSLSLLHLHVIK